MSTEKMEFNSSLSELDAKTTAVTPESVQVSDDIDYSDPYDIETQHFNPFAMSLRNLQPDDITQPTAPKKRGLDVADIFRYLLLAVCVGVFIYSAYSVVDRLLQYRKASAEYDEIRDMFSLDTINDVMGASMRKALPDTPSPEVLSAIGQVIPKAERPLITNDPTADIYMFIKAKLERLKAKNKDVIGYIVVDNTKINYPVVQGKDYEYYLHYTAELNYNMNGAIFTDYRNTTPLEKNRNTIIYGHNMTDGSMFNTVANFRYNAKMFNESVIKIYTFDGVYTYEIFSFYKTEATDPYIQTDFATDEAWMEFLDYRTSLSMFKKPLNLSPEDTIITLSTCTNVGDGRYALHARLISIVSDDPEKCFDISQRG